MDLERLHALGFTLMVGQVDYKNRNYGTFGKHGATLTDEGLALVEQLEAEAAASAPAPEAAPAPRRGRRAAAETPQPTVDSDIEALGSLLQE